MGNNLDPRKSQLDIKQELSHFKNYPQVLSGGRTWNTTHKIKLSQTPESCKLKRKYEVIHIF